MPDSLRSSMLVVAADGELPADSAIWGTGGWMEPSRREALDWLTLARLLGWSATVGREKGGEIAADSSTGHRWVVLACDTDTLGDESVALLASMLAQWPVLVVARAGAAKTPWARLAGATRRAGCVSGHDVRWTGPYDERHWRCRCALQGHALDASPEVTNWATLDGAPWIAARRVGVGTIATLAFHPGEARDADGAATSLLKHLLIWGTPAPVAWLDLERTLVLRMDDPGSSENVHHRIYSHTKLDEAGWASVGADLRRHDARLSLGYVTGWVDDGDIGRGTLFVGGSESQRTPGAIHPSPLVQYRQHTGTGMLHDYMAEFRGIQQLRAAGLAEVELHGYTHIHPDTAAWVAAPDRYEDAQWFRELGAAATDTIAAASPGRHPLVLAMAAMEKYFGVRPTTLISPGDQWTNAVLARALELGLQLVSSYYLALRDSHRFWWVQHVCAPYLDKPESAWFEAGVPVVGYLHDFDLCVNGVGWLSRWLDAWTTAGAARMIDLRELASILGRRLHMEEQADSLSLHISSEGAPALVRPLRVALRLNERDTRSHITVESEGRELSLPVESTQTGVGRLSIPAL